MIGQEHQPPSPKQRRHRWWIYALVGVGGVVAFVIVAAVVLLLGGLVFGRSIVNTYTTTTARPFPKVEHNPQFQKQAQKELQNRWSEFAKAVMSRQNPPPFKISADDLNSFFAAQQGFRDRLRFVITNNQLQAQFSAPLEQSGLKFLKGRYLNGTATINIVFQDGWLTVSLGKVEANGKTVPGWMLSRLRRQNFTQMLDQNRDLVNLFQEIESIQVQDGAIVLTPTK